MDLVLSVRTILEQMYLLIIISEDCMKYVDEITDYSYGTLMPQSDNRNAIQDTS